MNRERFCLLLRRHAVPLESGEEELLMSYNSTHLTPQQCVSTAAAILRRKLWFKFNGETGILTVTHLERDSASDWVQVG